MGKVKNCWLRGFWRSLMIAALVLLPSALIGKFEISELIIIFTAILLVGTLIFGVIYYMYEQRKRDKC